VIGGGPLMGELMDIAERKIEAAKTRYRAHLHPHLTRILTDAAIVEIRRASGEDVTTAQTAVDASLANLTLEEKDHLILEARATALEAVLTLLVKVLPAA
jgi:hypothetical protein